MGRAHRTRRPRVCAKQMQAGPLQSSYGTAPETAPGVGMQRRARCSMRSTGTSLCASEGQVGVGGRPPVSTGDTQGVSRVLLSVTPDHSPQGGGGAGKSEGGRSRGGEREREHEPQSCPVIADSPGKPLGSCSPGGLGRSPGLLSPPSPV